ncbi:MAG: IPT/TIG domain-containing protein [Bdellovibrionaceae bacterium]|nr:IPT/TIG domain-containing protein [Pseudobdellovibrionaceae bacterium]
MGSSIKPLFLVGLLSSVSCTLNISVTKKASSQTSPTISIVDVTPKESFFLGGEKIKILGSGFQQGLKIKIDDSECTDVSVLNANEIGCRIPKYQIQTSTSSSKKLNITIASSDGTQVSLPESFQYKSDAFTKIEHFSGSLSHAGRKNGIGTNARFFRPSGVAIHDNYMYISDTGNQLIRRVNLTSLETEDFAGSYLQAGTVDGIGTNSKLNDPMGLTIVGGQFVCCGKWFMRRKKNKLNNTKRFRFRRTTGQLRFGN